MIYGGLMNWVVGLRYKQLLRKNLDYLYPVYKQKYGIDLRKFIYNLKGLHQFEEELNWKVHNH